MAILKEHRGDYGLQRLYGNLGAIFLTPISGILIDHSSSVSGEQDYRWDTEEKWTAASFVSFSWVCVNVENKF